MYRPVLILAPFLLFALPLASRMWRSPDLWVNWFALGLTLLGFGLAWASWRKRHDTSKPKWYSLRPGALALAVVPLLVAWFAFRVPAPMGEGPAGPDVDAAAFAQTWSERPVVLLAIGDSVSTGYGAPEGHGYFELLADNVEETYPGMDGIELRRVLPNLRREVRASNSSNSIRHLQTIESLPKYPDETFGIVCMTTGGIDLIHYYGKREPVEGAMYGATWEQAEPWIENFEARLDTMVVTLNEKFPGGCVVMLANIYEPTDGVGDIENAGPLFWLPSWDDGKLIHGTFNDRIAAVAARHEHVHLVDMHGVMLGHGIHCRDRTNPHYDANDPTYWFYANLEDPNQRGYDAIRRVFLNAVVKALRDDRRFSVPAR